jgi:hypothetical protein
MLRPQRLLVTIERPHIHLFRLIELALFAVEDAKTVDGIES